MFSFTEAAFKIKFILATMAFLLSLNSPAAALRCEALFNKNPAIPQLTQFEKAKLVTGLFMRRFAPQLMTDGMAKSLFGSIKNLLADTTGKRVENKVTAATEVVNQAISNFKIKIGKLDLTLVDRDLQMDGFRNVTYTDYTQPFAVSLNVLRKYGFEIRDQLKNNMQDSINVKIRIRSYGIVSKLLTTFGIKDIQFAEFTKERAFVELKFKDASYDGAVFKPQAYMKKEYTSLFGTPDFIKRYDEIKADTLAHLKISAKKTLDQTSVESMLEFLREAHANQFNLSIVATNIYERSAKSLILKYDATKDPDYNTVFGAVENIELQMTFDQLISLYIPGNEINLGEGQYYRAYESTQTVSEFKTPTLIAHHLKRAQDEAKRQGREGLIISPAHAELLAKILPGLKEYFEMMDEIIQARDEAKALNSGKWGIAIKKIKSEIENYLNQLYVDDYEVVH